MKCERECEKTERMCSLSLLHSLCFSTPNGRKLQPAEVASYDLLRYNLTDPPRIFN